MNPFVRISIAIAGAAVCASASFAQAQISSLSDREAILATADRFAVETVNEEVLARFSRISDPFFLPEPEVPATGMNSAGGSSAGSFAAPLSDNEILAGISELINPSGVLEFGSNTLLLLGEQRVPVGGFLSVQYKGNKYRVQLLKADAKAFVLRLNEATILKRIQ